MEPQWTSGPTPIRRPVAKPFQVALESDGFPPSPALLRFPARADSSGINPGAVTRAIEDLWRSGYRPLRPPSAALPRCPGASRLPARQGVGGEADSMPGGSSPAGS